MEYDVDMDIGFAGYDATTMANGANAQAKDAAVVRKAFMDVVTERKKRVFALSFIHACLVFV